MPDLQEERVSDGPPFVNAGVDFADPLYVWKLKLMYAFLTCAATRSVHLE